MKIKVCGMKHPNQVNDLDSLVDFIGFIFHEKSQRFVESVPTSGQAHRVGVFVHEELKSLEMLVKKYSLDYVQLHGSESPEYCAEASDVAKVIKAFGIDEEFQFDRLAAYEHVDLFLFDTKTILHGGSGKQFDWSLLNSYTGNVPFLLSGGINPSSVEAIKTISHSRFYGVDLNSGFESIPGNKNIELINTFIDAIKDRIIYKA